MGNDNTFEGISGISLWNAKNVDLSTHRRREDDLGKLYKVKRTFR